MARVEPIRDKNDIRNMQAYFDNSNDRDSLLFYLSLNSALRISDLLKLRVEDVRNKKSIRLSEQKTGKFREVPLLGHVQKRLNDYCRDKEDHIFLFKALYRKVNKPINRSTAWRIISKGAKECGIENVGTHTGRKTFGYHYYKDSGGDIVTLMKVFNHNDQRTTLIYIGIEQDQISANIKKFGGFK